MRILDNSPHRRVIFSPMKSSQTLPKPAKKKAIKKPTMRRPLPAARMGEPGPAKEHAAPDHHTELEEHFEEYEMSKSPGS